ncbi:hypothetical protein [Sphingobacterium deserti]|nr:hypothetical protein [Sphingobacterium deserti]
MNLLYEINENTPHQLKDKVSMISIWNDKPLPIAEGEKLEQLSSGIL